jgi:tetratricopeptide (TPR) repeat protein
VKRIVPAFLAACLFVASASAARAADKPAADKPTADKPAAAKPAATKPAAAKSGAAAPAALDSLGLLERAVARDSSKFDNLFRLGVMYLDHDNAEKAAQVFLKAQQIKPNDVPLLVNLGVAFDALGRVEAQTYYQSALKIAPDDVIAGCRLASSLYSRANYQEAMNVLREIIAKHPDTHCAYFTLGVAFADAGIYRDAIRMWKKVVDLAPSSPEAVSARESIEVLERFIKGQ